MIRLGVSCEGPTEREFVSRTLAPHLATLAVFVTPVTLSGPPNLDRIAAELKRLLPGFDQVTTLYDYYGFLRRGDLDPDALQAAISARAPEASRGRLIPYVQRYEFEALIFADPQRVGDALQAPALTLGMAKALAACGGPEDIDDGFETCPSRRLKALYPPWDKVLHGPSLAAVIGLPELRRQCPRFGAWVDRLERLTAVPAP